MVDQTVGPGFPGYLSALPVKLAGDCRPPPGSCIGEDLLDLPGGPRVFGVEGGHFSVRVGPYYF